MPLPNSITLVKDKADESQDFKDGLTKDEREAAERLKASFGLVERSNEEVIDLELKKNYYYLLDENNVIID